MVEQREAGDRAVRPNVVFLLSDNIGWGDLSSYGGTVPTPNIDRIGDEGVRLTNYSVEAQCTPSRSAIMTGRLPVRSGTQKVPLPGEGDYGLSPWEYTLADLFSDAGYRSALFGKWHLGAVEGRLPTDQGFDEWWGIKNTSDEATYVDHPLFSESGLEAPCIWAGRKGSRSEPVGALNIEMRRRLDEEINARALSYIDDCCDGDEPFFLYVGYTIMHAPWVAHPDFVGSGGGGTRADLLAEMDERVGAIIRKLEERGVLDNTILIYSSDNASCSIGGEGGGSNGPWRGDFFTPPFEGSYRVPAVVRLPGDGARGSRLDDLVSAVDWLPTLASLIDRSDALPADRPYDGIDVSAYLAGDRDESGRQSVVFYGPDGSLMSVKWRTLKIIYRYSNGVDQPIVTPMWPMMYDLRSDPQERSNVFEQEIEGMWISQPASRVLSGLRESMSMFPNIPVGSDFRGYPSTDTHSP